MRWIVVLAATSLVACGSEQPAMPAPRPASSSSLLSQGEMGLSDRVIVKKASLQGGRYAIVLENALSDPLECRVEVRFLERSGRLLIPVDPRPRIAKFKPRGQVGLEGDCPFPEAAKVAVRLSD